MIGWILVRRMSVCATWPEAVMTHGVDRRDVVWADVAVVDGGVGFRDPVGLLPVRVSSDLFQQPQFHWTTLIVPPEEHKQKLHCCSTSSDRLEALTAST